MMYHAGYGCELETTMVEITVNVIWHCCRLSKCHISCRRPHPQGVLTCVLALEETANSPESLPNASVFDQKVA